MRDGGLEAQTMSTADASPGSDAAWPSNAVWPPDVLDIIWAYYKGWLWSRIKWRSWRHVHQAVLLSSQLMLVEAHEDAMRIMLFLQKVRPATDPEIFQYIRIHKRDVQEYILEECYKLPHRIIRHPEWRGGQSNPLLFAVHWIQGKDKERRERLLAMAAWQAWENYFEIGWKVGSNELFSLVQTNVSDLGVSQYPI